MEFGEYGICCRPTLKMHLKLFLVFFACFEAIDLASLKTLARMRYPKKNPKKAGFRNALKRTIQLNGCLYIRQHVAIYCLDKEVDNSGMHTTLRLPKENDLEEV